MSDAPVDNLLRDLAAELQIAPSPEMAASIRTRVHRSVERAPFVPTWTLAIALTVLVGALVMTIEPGRSRARGAGVPFATARATATAEGAAAPRPGATDAIDTPIAVNAPPRPGRPSTPRVLADPAATIAAAGPQMIVPADQAIALQRILATMRAGGSPVPPAMAVAVDAEGRMPAPALIEIPEITIERLLPPANGGGSREW